MRLIITFIVLVLGVLSVNQNVYASLFNKESVRVYDLARLESDLKKDCKDSLCGTTEKFANAFQLKSTNDAIIHSFILALKEKKTKKAADILNMGGTDHFFPIRLGSYFSASYGAIPFHNGILGILNEGQGDAGIKFFYIVVDNNQLIRVTMDGVLLFQPKELTDISISKHIIKNITMIGLNAKYEEIDSFMFAICPYNAKTSAQCDDKEAFRKYLFGITPNKALDEWKKAFQKKIKKISSFSKL